MDETTKINVEEHLGFALGHLHKAIGHLHKAMELQLHIDDHMSAYYRDTFKAYDLTSRILDSLRKEVPTE